MSGGICGQPTANGPCRNRTTDGGPCWRHGGQLPPVGDPDRVRLVREALDAKKRAAERPPADPLGPPPITDDQVAEIAATLTAHDVPYIIIGGYGAQLHGAPIDKTRDADIVTPTDQNTLERLSAALRALDARLRVQGQPDGVPVDITPEFFKPLITATFITRAGPLDVCFRPDGTGGYDDLARSSELRPLGGTPVPTASLDDIIRSKQAAGRTKDIVAVAILKRYQQHLRR